MDFKLNDELSVFCRNVKRLRQSHGLSKKEMAEIMGIGTESLSKIEGGTIPPRLNTSVLLRLARRFCLKLPELFLPLE